MNNRVRLPALRCIRYEVALNGWRILKDTINDFSLWRIIEYPWCVDALDLKRGDTVFDLGTGTATLPQMLAREGVNTVVLEIDKDRVHWQLNKWRETRREGDGIVYPVVADATELPLRDASITRLSAISSMEHVPDDSNVGVEIGRVLKPNGVAVVTLPYTPNERTSFFAGIRKFQRVARNAFVQEGKAGSFFRFYNDADLEEKYIKPSGGKVTRWGGFGRSILNNRYHETKLTKYWRRFILKDWILSKTIHPLEERFDSTPPLYKMFKIVKDA